MNIWNWMPTIIAVTAIVTNIIVFMAFRISADKKRIEELEATSYAFKRKIQQLQESKNICINTSKMTASDIQDYKKLLERLNETMVAVTDELNRLGNVFYTIEKGREQ